jgi:hypothetical protein
LYSRDFTDYFRRFFYLIENKNRVRIAKAARTLGIGIVTITVSIPFSIPNQLLAESTPDEISISGLIILSVFFGSPLIFMGLACYIGLNSKAHQILNPTTVKEKLGYYSPIQQKKEL